MEKLVKKIFINAEIRLLTGLHIGGTNSAMSIGGADSTVVRNPVNNEPYIPGSSLKGKMRAVIEISDGTLGEARMGDIKHVSSDDPATNSGMLFGTARKDDKQRPSRLIVRDGQLLSDISELGDTDLPYTESKTEVVLDRITAKANPRQIERVPAGARFKLDMVLNVFSGDDEKRQLETVFRALKLLKDDYLGGSGSRGYGQVDFSNVSVVEKEIDKYFNEGYQGTDITSDWKSKLD